MQLGENAILRVFCQQFSPVAIRFLATLTAYGQELSKEILNGVCLTACSQPFGSERLFRDLIATGFISPVAIRFFATYTAYGLRPTDRNSLKKYSMRVVNGTGSTAYGLRPTAYGLRPTDQRPRTAISSERLFRDLIATGEFCILQALVKCHTSARNHLI